MHKLFLRIGLPAALLGAACVALVLRLDVQEPDAPAAPPLPALAAAVRVPPPLIPIAKPGMQHTGTATLAQQVDKLVTSGLATDSYRAYALLAQCDQFNRLQDRMIFDDLASSSALPDALPDMRGMSAAEKQDAARLCAPMTERMRLSRLDYLAAAAKAGVPGAAVQFALEGPFGDRSALTTRPDDLLVQEWKTRARAYLHLAADREADIDTLHFLLAEYDNGSALSEKNPALTYRYALAIDAIMDDLSGRPTAFIRIFGEDSPVARAAAAQLSEDQRVAEKSAARHIAAIAHEQRQHAGDKS